MSKKSLVEILSHRLRRSPPVFSALVRFFEGTEDFLDWVRVVRNLLPEREAEILAGATVAEQIGLFASHFQTRYFPLEESFLWDMEDFRYCDFLRCIPVQVMGWDWETYHNLEDYRGGMQLMTYFWENPWEDDDEARVSLAEMCAAHVSQQTLQMVPLGGFKIDEVGPLLEQSPYRPLYEWGLYMRNDTGNFFLDTDYEYLWGGYGGIDWERDTVEELTRHWQLSEEIYNRFVLFSEWLEDDPENRFLEIINFVEKGGDNDSEK